MNIKYSIIIPSKNGMDGLKVTLPYILSIDRGDIEVVVSDNYSTDGLWDYLETINDPRLKIYRPEKRIPHSEHLNFAYSKASGEWIGHIGDDDLILKNRFDVLDRVTDGCDLVVGKSLRYIWGDHKLEPGNSIGTDNLGLYSLENNRVSGVEYYNDIINSVNVPGGGCWLVNRKVYSAVVHDFGYFSPDAANVEFFSLRASAYYSKKVNLIDYPLFINGRMNKSSGSTLLMADKKIFDWGFENPGGGWKYCPIPTYTYCTVSLDAALRVENMVRSNMLSSIHWGMNCMGAFLYKAYGVDSTNNRPKLSKIFLSIIYNYPLGSVYVITRRLMSVLVFRIRLLCKSDKSKYGFIIDHGAMKYVSGDFVLIDNIVDFAEWYLKYNSR